MTRRKKETKQNRDIKYTSLKNNYESKKEEQESGDEPILQDYQAGLMTSCLLLCVYLASLHPSVPGGDSGELITAAHELGVAHPPGYPLFTLLSKAAMILIRYGSPAWKVNLLNAAMSAGAGGLLITTQLRLSGDLGTGLLVVALFCFNPLTWTWAITAEVFALNNLLLAAILLVCVEFEGSVAQGEEEAVGSDERRESEQRTTKLCHVGCVLCGLSLCNQHTAVLYVLPIALWVILALHKHRMLSLRLLLSLVATSCLSLTPYLYLVVSSLMDRARWTWGDQTTLSGLLRHVLRAEYGTFQLGKDSLGQGFVTGLTAYFEHTWHSLLGIGPLLAVFGAIASVTVHRRVGERSLFVFIIMLALYVLFFSWRANLDVNDPLFRGVVERFWMQSDMVVVILAGVGLHPLVRWMTEKILGSDKESMTSVFTMILGVCVLALNLQNFPAMNQSQNMVVHDFGETILQNFPKNAIVFTKGDLPSNSLRYLHLCEGMRPDISLVDLEILTYPWSVPRLGKATPAVTFPGDFWHTTAGLWEDGRVSFNINMLLKANYQRSPLFVCIGMTERDLSWHSDFTLWPWGPCQRIVSRDTAMDAAAWGESTRGYAESWKYRLDSFPESSWEKVANDEMWNAKISSAFYMYQASEEAPDAKAKTDFLLQAYELYFAAIKSNQENGRMNAQVLYPPYWHKNFALVCERLLYVDTSHSKSQLCKTSVYHFEQYLSWLSRGKAPADSEVNGIRDAITNLRGRIDTYEKLDAVQRTFTPKVRT